MLKAQFWKSFNNSEANPKFILSNKNSNMDCSEQ